MPSGCGWDLLGFGKNLDASAGGLIDTVLAAGEDIYIADAAAGTGTKVKPVETGHVCGVFGISEDGAMTEAALRLNTDPNYIYRGHFCIKGQAEVLPPTNLVGLCNRKIVKGEDRMIASITNGAAKMDSVFAIIGKGGVIPRLYTDPPNGLLPEGTSLVSATMSTTATADTWSEGDISFESFEIREGKSYKILGAAAHGTTLQAIRFVSKSPQDKTNRPGIPGGDTDLIYNLCYFSHPFVFDGDTGLRGQILCSATDSATQILLVIQEI